MDLGHAGAQHHGLDAVPVEDVGVAPAAAQGGEALHAHALSRVQHHLHGLAVFGHPVGHVVGSELDLQLGPRLVAGRLQAVLHVGGLGVQLVEVAAADLGDEAHPIGHDVGGVFGFDGADVAGGLLVDAEEVHPGDALSGHLDGADALLGGESGVGPLAHHVGEDLDLAGGPYDHLAHVAGGIQHEGPLALKLAHVEGLGAPHAALLADGEDHLGGAVGEPLLEDRGDGLQDPADAGLVVPAQDGVGAALDDPVLDEGAYALAGDHGVHVGGEHEGVSGQGAGEAEEHVESVGTEGLAGLVGDGIEAQGLHVPDQGLAHDLLVAAFGIDLDVAEKGVEQSFSVDHVVFLLNQNVLYPKWGENSITWQGRWGAWPPPAGRRPCPRRRTGGGPGGTSAARRPGICRCRWR